MKKHVLFAFALLTLSAPAFISLAGAAPPFPFFKKAAAEETTELTWQTDLQKAHEIATAVNKPMLLVFGADWCHYCKKLEKETLQEPELAKYVSETFVPVHLDADKDKRAAQILNVKGLPCTVVLSPNADLLGRIDGFHTAKPYIQKLAAAKQKHQVVQQTSVTK